MRERRRYSDGTTWRDSFDSGSSGALPVAIEVAVWFGDPSVATGGGTTTKSPAAAGGPASTTKQSGSAQDQASTPGDAAGDAMSGSPQGSLSSGSPPLPQREPDRLRVIVVPDGPVTSWKESR